MSAFILMIIVVLINGAVGESWELLPGISAVQVSARSNLAIPDSAVVWAVNKQFQLFLYDNSNKTWTKQRENVKTVGAAFDNSAWIVTRAGKVFRYQENRFSPVKIGPDVNEKMVHISGRTYNEALAVDNNEGVYHFVNEMWKKLPDAATPGAKGEARVAIGQDGSKWIINRARQVYRWSDADGGWILQGIPAAAAKSGDVYNYTRAVITSWDINVWPRTYTWNGIDWHELTGIVCTQASITATKVYCVNQFQQILHS